MRTRTDPLIHPNRLGQDEAVEIRGGKNVTRQ